jgi:hypothetical protein
VWLEFGGRLLAIFGLPPPVHWSEAGYERWRGRIHGRAWVLIRCHLPWTPETYEALRMMRVRCEPGARMVLARPYILTVWPRGY